MQIIDIHPHVIAADHMRYPLAPVGDKLSAWAAQRPVTREQLLAAMDEAGVAQAVLVQASTAHGHDNRYTADSAAAHPTRLAWVGSLDALAPDAPDRLTYWVRERGMAGLRLFTAGSTMTEQAPWLGDPAVHRSHQSALVRKNPDHYRPLFPDVPDDLPYVWPLSDRPRRLS